VTTSKLAPLSRCSESQDPAARLQGVAGPGQVVIDAATRRQIRGLFEYRDLGNVALKGFDENVPVWQVVGAGTESRFEAVHGPTTPLVGRARKWSYCSAVRRRRRAATDEWF
jgi:hypothetical protein